MNLSDLMKAMADAGAPMEAIIMAVRAVEAEQEKSATQAAEIERRRSVERDRKRRQRANDLDGNVCVTGQSRDNPDDVTGHVQDAPPFLPPNEINSNPPAFTPENSTPPARKGHRLPLDWYPAPLPSQLAQDVAAWPVGAMERELSKFRDWAAGASGNAARKSDWDAAWRNWLRRASEDGKYTSKSSISGLQRPDPLRSALADAIAECEAEERQCSASNQADYPGSFAALPAH